MGGMPRASSCRSTIRAGVGQLQNQFQPISRRALERKPKTFKQNWQNDHKIGGMTFAIFIDLGVLINNQIVLEKIEDTHIYFKARSDHFRLLYPSVYARIVVRPI